MPCEVTVLLAECQQGASVLLNPGCGVCFGCLVGKLQFTGHNYRDAVPQFIAHSFRLLVCFGRFFDEQVLGSASTCFWRRC